MSDDAAMTVPRDHERATGAAPRYTVFVVPHTHWDREWYQPFQAFRARLLDVIDGVLDLLSSEPRYRRFTLDGQAVILDDYLALRPKRRPEIVEHVRSGRLRVGPWYVLADEFLVSPEALIRNLEFGRRTCAEFGPAMSVAYTPDSFGHVSQLPTIVRGFGLGSIVFERGVGDEGERLRGEFHWTGADETSTVFAVHLLTTYSGATAMGHLDWELGDAFDPKRAVSQMRSVLYGPGDQPPDFPAWLRDAVLRLPKGAAGYATGPSLMVLNGSDHLFAQPNVPDVLDLLDAEFPGLHFVQADVEEFVNAARRPPGELEAYRGEFRGSRYHHVLSGVLSARIYLKQANHRAQNLLEREAEPLAALAALNGAPHPHALLREAWRLLLLNHPHDSICGCSIDPVHREMLTRFEQVEQLGEEVKRRALAALVGGPGGDHLAIFEPVPVAGDRVVSTRLELPLGAADGLRLEDASGRRLPLQTTSSVRHLAGRSDVEVEDVELTFLAPVVPSGVSVVRVVTDAGRAPPATARPDEAIEPAGPVSAVSAVSEPGALIMRNGKLSVKVSTAPDDLGSVTLTEEASGIAYDLNLRFADEADAGDEYDFSSLPHHEVLVFDRPSSTPMFMATGPVRATARLEYLLRLPHKLKDDRRSRQGEVEVPVVVELSLDAGAARLDANVTLVNTAEDHRLRLLVDSGCRVDHVWADGHFHVLKRPTRPPSGKGWYQKPSGTSHQRRFVAVSDETRGLAVLNRGLCEYEAIDPEAVGTEATDPAATGREATGVEANDPAATRPAATARDGVTLAVTLLRCVGWLSREDLISRPQGAGPSLPTPEAQCLGEHRFEFAFVPFTGPWWDGPLPLEAERFGSPAVVAGASRLARFSAIELTPPLTLSAFKAPWREEAGAAPSNNAIVRIWNPAPVAVKGQLTLHLPVAEAFRVRLDESRGPAITPRDGHIELTLGPAEVVTLELSFRA